MKKQFLAALALLVFSLLTKAQTTQTEYDYITKGYRSVEEAGMDVKNGYSFRDITSLTTQAQEGKLLYKRTAALKALYRETGTGSRKIAAYMIIYQKEGSPKEYLCVPNPYSPQAIFQQFSHALYSGEGEQSNRLQTISLLLAKGLIWYE